MDMTIDLTQIILAIITLISGIAVRYLVPLMKEKLDREKIDTLLKIADVGVYAAEQMIGPDKGAEKKAFVQDYLREKGYDVDLADVDAAIEAAVKNLKIAIKE